MNRVTKKNVKPLRGKELHMIEYLLVAKFIYLKKISVLQYVFISFLLIKWGVFFFAVLYKTICAVIKCLTGIFMTVC